MLVTQYYILHANTILLLGGVGGGGGEMSMKINRYEVGETKYKHWQLF